MNEGLLEGVGSGQAGTRGRFAYTYVSTTQTVNGPAWARYVSIFGAGAGGGGGGGRLASASAASGGGGGGGGGSRYLYRLPVAQNPNANMRRWLCTIGAGGTGGSGATSDPSDGGGGTGGGQTQLSFNYLSDSATPRLQIGIAANGGGGGSGGTTTTASGGSSGAGGMNVVGSPGGSGSTTTPSNGGYTATGYVVTSIQAGQGATGKNSAAILVVPLSNSFGVLQTSVQGTGQFSTNGNNGETFHRHLFMIGLNTLVRAPHPHELHFVSGAGGEAGTGADTTTANAAGNGGKGWNGTGGGGGGGAGGTAGSKGGNGGNGGDGYALFFWEEF